MLDAKAAAGKVVVGFDDPERRRGANGRRARSLRISPRAERGAPRTAAARGPPIVETMTTAPPLTLNARHRLERPVRELMTPGVITIPEDSSLRQAYRAMAEHRVNSLLVLGARHGTPLGWVTARGLLAWLDRDPDLNLVGKAVTEQPIAVHPTASARDALTALSRAGVSQMMVTRGEDRLPQGVVTPADLVALAGG
jgi:CBS domain-containing protein